MFWCLLALPMLLTSSVKALEKGTELVAKARKVITAELPMTGKLGVRVVVQSSEIPKVQAGDRQTLLDAMDRAEVLQKTGQAKDCPHCGEFHFSALIDSGSCPGCMQQAQRTT
jgi:hypothetical protein